MAYALRFDGIDDYILNYSPAIVTTASTSISLEVDFAAQSTAQADKKLYKFGGGAGTTAYFALMADGTLRAFTRAGSGGVDFNLFTPVLENNQRYLARLDIDLTTGLTELFLDGVLQQQVTNSGLVGLAPTDFRIFGAETTASGFAAFDLYGVKEFIDGVQISFHDADASNGTGSILPETLNGDDGALANFSTDGSQWVQTGPNLTITQATLTPGGTISGTYANYATVPTTLTVSDGTNTISSAGASPKITGLTIDDTAKTFTATIVALPTTGTANMILFTDTATVELS